MLSSQASPERDDRDKTCKSISKMDYLSAVDVVTNHRVLSERYTALARATGIIGIVFMVLLFGPIIALSSAGEPPLDATPSEAVKYFGDIEANWAQLAIAASTLGWIGSLWFFVAFGYLLRHVEGDPPWRSTIATLSGGWRHTDWLAPAWGRPRCTGARSPPTSPTSRGRSPMSASRTHGSLSRASHSVPAG